MTELRATAHLDPDPADPLAFAGDHGACFVQDHTGVAGRGVAWSGPAPEVVDRLAAIPVEVQGELPAGLETPTPRALVARPFDPHGVARAVVPAHQLIMAPTGPAVTLTITGELETPATDAPPGPGTSEAGAEPGSFTVTSVRPPAAWCDAVTTATRRISDGPLDKVVLAREVAVSADEAISPVRVLDRLRTAYPGCYLYLIEGFLGATPELLVGRAGQTVTAQPMAGTTARRGDPATDRAATRALAESPAYRHEHRVTIDAVHDALLGFCSYLDEEPEPAVVTLANVSHLATRVEGLLSEPPASVLDLAEALHPTPAVCGRPRDVALAAIADLEGFERGTYGGAVGWVDAGGNGSFAVAIRGAIVSGTEARLYAGNGLVAGADPTTELAETRAKLQAVLTAIVRP